jgi:hypothetical protein
MRGFKTSVILALIAASSFPTESGVARANPNRHDGFDVSVIPGYLGDNATDENVQEQVRQLFYNSRSVKQGARRQQIMRDDNAERLLEITQLDWTVDDATKENGLSRVHVSGIVSSNYQYCLLIKTVYKGLKYILDSRYGLIDRNGSVLWVRQWTYFGLPRVSNLGLCAIISVDTSSIDQNRTHSPEVLINLVGTGGDIKGTWQRKRSACRENISRRLGLSEFYDFSPNGEHLYVTFNVENADMNTRSPVCWTTYVLCINTFGEVLWETPVGELDSSRMLFSDDGKRIVWTGSGAGADRYETLNEITILTNEGEVLLRHERAGRGKADCKLFGDELLIKWDYGEETADIRTGRLTESQEKGP